MPKDTYDFIFKEYSGISSLNRDKIHWISLISLFNKILVYEPASSHEKAIFLEAKKFLDSKDIDKFSKEYKRQVENCLIIIGEKLSYFDT